MLSWDRDRKTKVFDLKRRMLRDAREKEAAEMQKAGKYVNKGSLRYLSKKENVDKHVENRLINFGYIAEAKRLRQAQDNFK